MKIKTNKSVLSWVLYDWGNSAFATTVMAGFFPVFFKQYWSTGIDVTESTFRLGIANSAAGIIVAFISPLLGAIADSLSSRKKFLLFFAMSGAVMSASLSMLSQGNYIGAIIIYICSVIGFSSANIFYDALLIFIAKDEDRDYVSSLGYAAGYLGGGILFACNVIITLYPSTFGIADASDAVKISFITVGIWWAAFSIPVFLFVKEPVNNKKTSYKSIIRKGFARIGNTFTDIKKYKTVIVFLTAYWLYIDGVDTIIRMAIDYGMALGFDSNSLIVALLITQFVGFPSAIAIGKAGRKIGTKNAIFFCIAVYSCVCIWAYYMQNINEFYAMAIVIGLVQGGIQALSRSMFSRLIPSDKAAEFFGFYNMLGKFAVVFGPVIMGATAFITGNARYSVLSIIILFISGGIILFFIKENKDNNK